MINGQLTKLGEHALNRIWWCKWYRPGVGHPNYGQQLLTALFEAGYLMAQYRDFGHGLEYSYAITEEGKEVCMALYVANRDPKANLQMNFAS